MDSYDMAVTQDDINVKTYPFPTRSVKPGHVYNLLKPSFTKYANKDALIQPSIQKKYTYKELEDEIERVAFNLRQHGVKKGDIVAFYALNSLEYAVMAIATWRLGAVYCGIHHQLKKDEALSLLTISKPSYVFTDLGGIETILEVIKALTFIKLVFIQEAHPRCISFSDLKTAPPKGQKLPALEDVDINDPACILHSSGTSGLPKAAIFSHENIFCSMMALTEPYVCLPDKIRQLIYMPLAHVFGSMLLFCGIAIGTTSVLMERFDFVQFLEIISKYKISSLLLGPPLIVLFITHPAVDQYDLSNLHEIFCGGAPLGEDAVRKFQDRMKGSIHVRQGYGLTETSALAFGLVRDAPTRLPSQSAGYAFPGVQVKIVDIKTGKSLGPNQHGEICGKGRTVIKGYLNDDKEVIDAEGWFHTGDIGYYKEDNTFFIVGRLKDLIKYKTSQIAPAQLEDLLLSHPLVADSGVIGIPDEEAGEIPLAFVVRKEASLTEKEVKEFVAEKVPEYKQLRGGVRFVDVIPKSSMGKIQRSQLRDSIDSMNQ